MLTSQDALFSYRPVLDVRGRIVALSVCYQPLSGPLLIDDDAAATSRLIDHACLGSRFPTLPDGRRVLVKVDPYFLESGMISMLPAQHSILELVGVDEVPESGREICRGYLRMGYQLALGAGWEDRVDDTWLDMAYIAKIDIAALDRERLQLMAEPLLGKGPVLLAENVQTRQSFEECRAAGFQLFEGFFFADPAGAAVRTLDPRRRNILHLLTCLGQDADDKTIEEAIKTSPDLTVHLLRLINSAAVGLRTHVGSVREILGLIGREKLAKWLQVLLYLTTDSRAHESLALLELALWRGRMIEQLVQDVTHMHGSSRQERAFMVGVLSLLDVLMGIPIEEAVSGVGVDEEVRQAVLTHGGVLGSLLGLCVSLQEADFEAVQAFARHWNIAPQRIMEVQQSAMLWAMTVVEQGMAGGGQ